MCKLDMKVIQKLCEIPQTLNRSRLSSTPSLFLTSFLIQRDILPSLTFYCASASLPYSILCYSPYCCLRGFLLYCVSQRDRRSRHIFQLTSFGSMRPLLSPLPTTLTLVGSMLCSMMTEPVTDISFSVFPFLDLMVHKSCTLGVLFASLCILHGYGFPGLCLFTDIFVQLDP